MTGSLSIPVPYGLSYLPYQTEGIGWARSRRAVLFGDDMGLGKTVQAIGWVNCQPWIQSALVVCPATLKVNWAREHAKWAVNPFIDLTVTNYERLDQLDFSRVWDTVILDEGHYIKSYDSQRSMACRKLRARSKLLLTGTPQLGRPIELWHQLHWLFPQRFPFAKRTEYSARYCGGHYGERGWEERGAANLEELNGLLKEVMIRRLKKDVLKDLPEKRRRVLELPAEGISAELWRRIRKDVAADDYARVLDGLRGGEDATWYEYAPLRHEAGRAKVPMAIEIVKDMLESEACVTVYGYHRDVLEGLRVGLTEYNPVVVHGGVTDRQQAVDAFQNDPRHRVFIGQLNAAGVGIGLTRASNMVIVEFDWSPIMDQVEDRINRIGQQDSTLITYLALQDSLDSRMAKVLMRKQIINERTLN